MQARTLWTIDQLGAQVALALSVDYAGAPNARVRDLPDRRTIRYYTTLGLFDRPAEMRGRVALYGPKHLLQLVAIKRLQARGLSLAEIQEQFLGRTEAALHELARLPDHFSSSVKTSAAAGRSRGSGSAERESTFWSTMPAPVPEAKVDKDQRQSAQSTSDPPANLQGIRLGEDVTLLIEGIRTVEEEDRSALRIAAAPLLKILEKRRLLRRRHERGTA